MLRWVIALLALANAGYFLWTQGHLAPLGLAPASEREPERLQSQIRPEVQRLLNAPRDGVAPAAPKPAAPVLPAAEPPTIEAPPPAPPTEQPAVAPEAATPAAPATAASVAAEPARACWQVGAFTEAQADRLRAAIPNLGLPASGWQLLETRNRGRWLVYLGRFDNAAQLERKRAELRALKVDFRTVTVPGLSPGLALGTYSAEASAQKALQNLTRQGVRSARVAQERAESVYFTLRLPAATPAQRDAVANLGNLLAGKTLQACE